MSLKTASFLVVSIFAGAGPANAQWANYQGYQIAPPSYPPYPSYPAPAPYPDYGSGDGYYSQPPAGPRPAARRGADYNDQGYDTGGYRQQGSGHADLGDSYASPPPRDRDALEAEADSSGRTAQVVPNPTHEPAGTIVVDTRSKHLYLVEADGQALQYGIGVGREGFAWKGEATVKHKAEWPAWNPPGDMLKRRPDLPEHMEGGIENPLGARALYLFKGNKDTLFRIHGTNEPDTIGKAVSSGCIRMMNADVIDLYKRVPVGTRVVVL